MFFGNNNKSGEGIQKYKAAENYGKLVKSLK